MQGKTITGLGPPSLISLGQDKCAFVFGAPGRRDGLKCGHLMPLSTEPLVFGKALDSAYLRPRNRGTPGICKGL